MPKKKQTFAQRLAALREKAGLTKNALAVLAGVAPIEISRFEQGLRPHGPTLRTAARLAGALGGDLGLFEGLDWKGEAA
jgi:transcriptional regulator with XRE-family HTH domain